MFQFNRYNLSLVEEETKLLTDLWVIIYAALQYFFLFNNSLLSSVWRASIHQHFLKFDCWPIDWTMNEFGFYCCLEKNKEKRIELLANEICAVQRISPPFRFLSRRKKRQEQTARIRSITYCVNGLTFENECFRF